MAALLEIELPTSAGALTQTAARLLLDRVNEKCMATTYSKTHGKREDQENLPRVILAVEPVIGVEGYRIETVCQNAVRVVGHDERGLLYGVGRLLRESRFEPGKWTPGPWRGSSVPRRPMRGMYFATHFHNVYHEAPVHVIQRYVEDLALWGCNTLSVWFDMHHFKEINDPQAQAMITRLKTILKAANRVGMGASLTTLANEAYAGSPEAMRAEPTPHHYKVELCPSKPGAMELLLRWRGEVLDAFSDIHFDSIWIWPHDQGGCLCKDCAPWGGNGFLRIAEPVAKMIRQKMPSAKVILSTWCFNYWQKTEWSELAKAFEKKPDWVDYLMVDSHGEFPEYPMKHGVPGKLRMLNFPEISMFKNYPWGGYGANPAPARFQAIWDSVGHALAGGYPYSEGVFEDINKSINLMHYWSDQNACETVRQYAAYEFGPDVAQDVVEIVRRLEEVFEVHLAPAASHPEQWDSKALPKIYQLPAAERAGVAYLQETAARVLACENKMTQQARTSWRWRIFFIRAMLDWELVKSDGRATDKSEAFMEELKEMYTAQNADWAVAVPTFKKIGGKETCNSQ